MTTELDKRADRFAIYLGAEIRGLIVSRGITQNGLAEAVGHQRASMANWLSAKPPVPMAVFHKICEYLDVEPQIPIERAERRVIDELGHYDDGTPPLTIDDLTEEQKKQIILEKLAQGDLTLATMRDPNKYLEREHGADDAA